MLVALLLCVAPQGADLIRLSNDWMEAVQKQDFAKAESFMAPEFQLVPWSGGAVVTRAKWLEGARQLKDAKFRFEEISAQVYGDTAVVYSLARFQYGGGAEKATVLADVWQRRDGKWLVVERRSVGSKSLEALLRP